jgi:hypothetical protein
MSLISLEISGAIFMLLQGINLNTGTFKNAPVFSKFKITQLSLKYDEAISTKLGII